MYIYIYIYIYIYTYIYYIDNVCMASYVYARMHALVYARTYFRWKPKQRFIETRPVSIQARYMCHDNKARTDTYTLHRNS